MNDTLSIPRLALLVKNHLVENKQRYTLYALGILAIAFIVYVLIFSVNSFHANYYTIIEGKVTNPDDTTEWETIQFIVYFAGLCCFGGIFACVSFVDFSNSAEAIFYLNKPASYLEKWLTEVIVRIGFLFLVYTIIFYVIDIPATFLVRGIEYTSSMDKSTIKEVGVTKIFHASDLFFFYMPNLNEGLVYILLASLYTSIVGFFMYGAVLFNKYSFFKTLFLAFFVGMIYFFYGFFIVESNFLMPGDWNYSFPIKANLDNVSSLLTTNIYDPNGGYRTSLDASVLSLVSLFLLIVVPLIIVACSYFKLKEKEV